MLVCFPSSSRESRKGIEASALRVWKHLGYEGPTSKLHRQEFIGGQKVALFLVFIGTSMLFSIVAVSIYIPTNCLRGSTGCSTPYFVMIQRGGRGWVGERSKKE